MLLEEGSQKWNLPVATGMILDKEELQSGSSRRMGMMVMVLV